MAYFEIINKIQDKVDTVMSGYTIQHMNQGQGNFTKPQNSKWIRCTIKPGGSATVCIGSQKRYRMPGVVILQIFVPIGTDDTVLNTAVGIAMLGFAYIDLAVGDSEGHIVKFVAPYPTDIGRVGGEYQINVTLPFQVDFTT
jgi:hypothetical protein